MGSYKVLYDYPNYASLPAVGDVSRLYITNDTNTLYRWVDGAYHFFTTTSVPWGNIDGVLTNQTDLMAVLNGKQPLITAGTTAQYYRGDKTFQTLNTTAVPEGTNLYWTDARFNTGFSGKTTSNLTEGTNLYYTDARFDARLATKSTTNLAEGTNLYYTQGRFDSAFGAKSTSNLAEGTNLYYTDARFDTRLASKTTDNLTEGATRLYYSSGRFNADFNSKTTDNLTEGANNFYWTPARSRNALTLLTVGTGGLATYNSTTGQLNIPQYQTLLTNPLVGAGAQYYVPRYSDTTTLTPGLIYDNGVYVGINRTNPFYTLDVNGTLNVEGTSILRALAGSGDRVVYVNSSGQITPATIGTGLSLASGVLTATGTGSGSIGGTGTSGYIPKFSGTSSIANSSIQDNGTGIVSIGSDLSLNGFNYGTITRVLPSGNLYYDKVYNLTRTDNTSNLLNRTIWNINNDSTSMGSFIADNLTVTFSRNITNTDSIFARAAFFGNNGTAPQTGYAFYANSGGTGNWTSFTHFRAGQYYGYGANSNSYTNYYAFVGTAPQNVTNSYGLVIDSSFNGSSNTRAIDLNVTAGTNKYNIYAAGTANNYLAGALGIGTTSLSNHNIYVTKNISGGTYAASIRSAATVASDVTNFANNFDSTLVTQATTFTLNRYNHFSTYVQSIGAGNTIVDQNAFFADATIIGATNNYGFRGQIPSGTNRWNIYMDGTANNYLGGDTSIGTTTLGTATKLTVGGSETVVNGLSRGQLINTTLVASANNDTTVGLEIIPTFTNGAFTGVNNIGLKLTNVNNATNDFIGKSSPQLQLNGALWNSSLGSVRMTAGIQVMRYSDNSNPTFSKLSFQVGSDNNLATEQLYITSSGLLGSNGGAIFSAGSGSYSNDINIIQTTPATSTVAYSSNRLVLRGTAWNSGQGYKFNMGYLQMINFVNNANPTTDKLSFFVGSADNANSVNTAGNATERLALRTDGIFSFFNSSTTETLRLFNTGNLLIQNGGTFTDAGYRLDVNGTARVQNTLTASQFALSALNTAPATATSTGTLGEVRIDASYIYVCTATNTWKRAAITTW